MSMNLLERKDDYLGITWHNKPEGFPDELFLFRIHNNDLFLKIWDDGVTSITSWFDEHCSGHLGYLLIPLDEYGMESKFCFAFTNIQDLMLFKLTWL